jgi:hypothetical protein
MPDIERKMMTASMHPDLAHEWSTLQNNIEQYEKSALAIKLIAIVLCALGSAFTRHGILMALLTCVLWIQEGVLRTFQARLVERILRIEQFIKQTVPANSDAFQLHTEWVGKRPDPAGLMQEYATSCLRPTVAFPYIVLIFISFGSIVA